MDPSPIPIQTHAPSTQDMPIIKTEERPRPIPAQLPHPPQRGQRYKDKFQTLREHYDTVTSKHTDYTRAVQRATEKEQRLQAEINMLLDSALAASSPLPPQLLQPAPQGQQTPTLSAPQSTTPTPAHAQLLLQLSPTTTTITQLATAPPGPPGLVPPRALTPPTGGPTSANAYSATAVHTNGHAPHPHSHSHSHSRSRSHNSRPPEQRENHHGTEYAPNYHRSSSSSSSSYYASPTGPPLQQPQPPPLPPSLAGSVTAVNASSGETPVPAPPSPPPSVHSRW